MTEVVHSWGTSQRGGVETCRLCSAKRRLRRSRQVGWEFLTENGWSNEEPKCGDLEELRKVGKVVGDIVVGGVKVTLVDKGNER